LFNFNIPGANVEKIEASDIAGYGDQNIMPCTTGYYNCAGFNYW
jgi:hypothetical protein